MKAPLTEDEKLVYSRPTVKEYGRMADLTATGSKPGEENNGNTEGSMI